MGHQQGLAGVQPQWTATIWVCLSAVQDHMISRSALRIHSISQCGSHRLSWGMELDKPSIPKQESQLRMRK